MKIELNEIILTTENPDEYSYGTELNSEWVCVNIGANRVAVKIDVLIEALKVMKLRG